MIGQCSIPAWYVAAPWPKFGFRVSRKPGWPRRLKHEIHRIKAPISRTLRFADVAALLPLGVDPARRQVFGYDATQAIAAAAHCLESDGLIMPSARAEWANLVAFPVDPGEYCPPSVQETQPVDWSSWRKR